MSYNDNNFGQNGYGGYDNRYNQYENQYNQYSQYGGQSPYDNQNPYNQYDAPYNQYGGQFGNQFSANTGNGGYGGYGVPQYAPIQADEITPQKFNLIIGGILLWGFLVNVFMIQFCFDSIFNLVAYNPIMFYIAYFVMAIAGTLMVKKSDNPVVSFIGYNLIVVPIGMVIAITVNAYVMVGYESVVVTAFLITAIVTIAMMFLSSVYPAFFLSLGRTLGITLLITIVVELIMLLLGASLGIIDYVVVIIFCGYIGYDWAKANAVAKTVDNAVDCAAELYLDIANLFLRLMRILARAQRN